MSFYFLDSTARSTWAAGTSEQGQLEALSGLWAGNVEVLYYTAGGTLLTTVLHDGLEINTATDPRRCYLGAYVSETKSADGTASYAILSLPSSTDILRCDVSLAGQILSTNGRTNLADLAPGGLVILATASLPAADIPAWRTVMSDTDTVYEIGGLPSAAAGDIVWPSAGAENTLYTGTDSNYVYMHYGYGGSVYASDLGAYGTMVFGTTGEAIFSEQLTQFPLTADSPAWTMFQQPEYAVSEAEAITMGADWYYSASDFAALESATPSRIVPRGAGEGDFVGGWDGNFPVGYTNWIIRRKSQGSYLGNGRWHSFRYEMPRYVPASMTGTGHGAIVIVTRGPIHGPFSQGQQPSGVSNSDWFDDVFASGARKYHMHAMDVVTKEWQRLSAVIPEFTGSGNAVLPRSCLDEANERVYYFAPSGTGYAVYYADLSGGLSGMTWGGPTTISDLTAGSISFTDSGSSVLAVPTSGANAGRRLWYMRSNAGGLVLVDLDNNTLDEFTITGLPSAGEWWGFGYRASSNELIITTKNASFGVRSYRITIPTDPTDEANYSVTMHALTLDSGVALESGIVLYQCGERSQYIDSLGVILMTQYTGKMLAYRPA